MSKELLEKMTEVATAHDEFKKANDKALAEAKTRLDGVSAETKAKLEKIEAAMDASLKAQDEIRAAMNRRQAEKQDGEAKSEYKAEFERVLRKGGEMNITDGMRAELKEMSAMIDEDGGFLVRPELSSEIVKKVYESSPVRQLASVQTISTDALEILCDLDEAAANWVTELQARDTTATPKLNMIRIPTHELCAKPRASQKVLDDAYLNLEAWLGEKVSDKFARAEATAFVSGDGVNKPKGLLAYADGTAFGQVQQVESATQAVLIADEFIDVQNALKGPYQANASWLMKRELVKVIRKFKDVANGNYLWQPGLSVAEPATLLGRPVYHADDMQALAAGSLSVIYGDIKQAYQIVDRIGIRVLRDPFSAKPYIEFYTTKRVGGAVKNFEAFKILKAKA